jgi:hypothetical protein
VAIRLAFMSRWESSVQEMRWTAENRPADRQFRPPRYSGVMEFESDFVLT